jgi:transcriptional regulator with XRE-family HTH domain
VNIKEIKNADGRGYREIARAAELGVAVVWRVVNGRTRRPTMQTVVKLAAVFGVDTPKIIEAIEDVNK